MRKGKLGGRRPSRRCAISTESSLAWAMIACSRRCSVASDRRFGLAAEFRDLLRRLREQICLLRLCRLPCLGDQPVALRADFCPRLVGVGTGIGGFLAGRRRVGQQLVRLLLPLGDDIHHRAKEEPAENPDENEDIDGLERQRPPVDVHGLSE